MLGKMMGHVGWGRKLHNCPDPAGGNHYHRLHSDRVFFFFSFFNFIYIEREMCHVAQFFNIIFVVRWHFIFVLKMGLFV